MQKAVFLTNDEPSEDVRAQFVCLLCFILFQEHDVDDSDAKEAALNPLDANLELVEAYLLSVFSKHESLTMRKIFEELKVPPMMSIDFCWVDWWRRSILPKASAAIKECIEFEENARCEKSEDVLKIQEMCSLAWFATHFLIYGTTVLEGIVLSNKIKKKLSKLTHRLINVPACGAPF